MMRVTSGFGTKLPSSDLRVVSAARCMAEVTVRGRHGGFWKVEGESFSQLRPVNALCVATIGGIMTRRRFMAVAAGAAAWPWMAWAQPATKATQIGLLYPGFEAVTVTRIAALRDGLRAVGYADADRAEILVRASEGDPSLKCWPRILSSEKWMQSSP